MHNQNKVLSLHFITIKTNEMKNFIKVSEAPKTKLQLKKAILNGTIIVYEKDMNWDKDFRVLNDLHSILSIWDGFRYAPKFQTESHIASAFLGTSFYYRFANA